jgi:hypothetical protein
MAKKKLTTEDYLNMPDEQFVKYKQAFIKNTLRRACYRWPWRNIAERLATPERGKRLCAKGPHLIPRAQRKMDHRAPIVDPATGFIDWDVFAHRMLVREWGWQVLCKEHHDEKTAEEREIRKNTARRKKEALK